MNIIKKLWQRHFGAQQPQSHANKCKKVGEICCPALDFREFLEFVCIHKCLAQKNCVCGSSADVELVSFCEPDTGKNLGNAFRIKDEKNITILSVSAKKMFSIAMTTASNFR